MLAYSCVCVAGVPREHVCIGPVSPCQAPGPTALPKVLLQACTYTQGCIAKSSSIDWRHKPALCQHCRSIEGMAGQLSVRAWGGSALSIIKPRNPGLRNGLRQSVIFGADHLYACVQAVYYARGQEMFVSCLMITLRVGRCGDPSYGWSTVRSFTTLQASGANEWPQRVGLIGDLGQTYNSSSTLQHLAANKPPVQSCQTNSK